MKTIAIQNMRWILKKHDAYLLTDSEKNNGNLNEFGRILINWYQVESAAFALWYTGIFTLEYFIIMRNQIWGIY